MKVICVLFALLAVASCGRLVSAANAPPSDSPPSKFEIGDVVSLKSGGPKMVVFTKDYDGDKWVYRTDYFDVAGVLREDDGINESVLVAAN